MKFSKPLLLTTVVLILSACTPVTTGVTTPTAEPTVPSSAENSLANTQWTLVSFGTRGAETSLVEGSAITLEFGEDGQAVGSGGCNSYGSKYQVQDNRLSFSQINSTLMACADERVMQQEQQYLQALESAGEFELTDDHLTISYDNGQAVLNFVKA